MKTKIPDRLKTAWDGFMAEAERCQKDGLVVVISNDDGPFTHGLYVFHGSQIIGKRTIELAGSSKADDA